MCDAKKAHVRKVLTEVFQEIDKDKSGYLDQTELEIVIKSFLAHPDCPPEAKAEHGSPAKIKALCEKFLAKVDTSGDKKISLDEFLKFFECC